jgi:hypothetical protein
MGSGQGWERCGAVAGSRDVRGRVNVRWYRSRPSGSSPPRWRALARSRGPVAGARSVTPGCVRPPAARVTANPPCPPAASDVDRDEQDTGRPLTARPRTRRRKTRTGEVGCSSTGLVPLRSCIDAAQTRTVMNRPRGVADDEPLAAADPVSGVLAAAGFRRCPRPSSSAATTFLVTIALCGLRNTSTRIARAGSPTATAATSTLCAPLRGSRS